MARDSSRVIARIFSTHNSEYASLTWEWIIRADGQVQYRLTHLRGRPERNPWISATRLSSTDLRAFREDRASAEAWLASLTLQRGHEVAGYPDSSTGAS
jgi:hypothetical protein